MVGQAGLAKLGGKVTFLTTRIMLGGGGGRHGPTRRGLGTRKQ